MIDHREEQAGVARLMAVGKGFIGRRAGGVETSGEGFGGSFFGGVFSFVDM
jgi:hypothetical protein